MSSVRQFLVRIEPDADKDISEAAEWYEAHRLGLDFVNAVDEAISRIAAQPYICGPVPGVDLPVRRAFTKRFPYAVVFMIVADEVVVIAIAHMKRRPKYWAPRIPG